MVWVDIVIKIMSLGTVRGGGFNCKTGKVSNKTAYIEPHNWSDVPEYDFITFDIPETKPKNTTNNFLKPV